MIQGRLRRRSFGGILVLGSLLVAASAAGGFAAADASPGAAAEAIERAFDEEGPILSQPDRAMIRAKCGSGARSDTGVQFNGGAPVCSNGRRVDDPEVRALAASIERRVKTHLDRAMRRPEVKAALNGEVDAHVRAALRRTEPELAKVHGAVARAVAAAAVAERHAGLAAARFGPAERARLRAELGRARAEIGAIDFEAIDRDIEAALDGARRSRESH
jgi:hypothetical protein